MCRGGRLLKSVLLVLTLFSLILLGCSQAPAPSAPPVPEAMLTVTPSVPPQASPPVRATVAPSPTPTLLPSPTPRVVAEPVIEHIGLEIDAFNPNTRMAGDFRFTQDPVFMNRLFHDFGERITETSDGKPKVNPQPTYIVPLGTKVRSLTSGTVVAITKLYSDDYSIHVAKDERSPWRYETEHVINPLVEVGDMVTAGQIIAEASPFSSHNNAGMGMFEIGILRGGGNGPTHVCPYAYLDESVKAEFLEKIRRLYADWESYIGKDVYDETGYEVPGCLTLDELPD